MSRNGLVPTPIVNKNGVYTTVYRKDGRTVTSSSNAPAPQLQSRFATRTLPIESVDRLAHSDDIEADRRDLSERLSQPTSSYSDQTIGLLSNSLRSGVPAPVLSWHIEAQIEEKQVATITALMLSLRDLLVTSKDNEDMETVHGKRFFASVHYLKIAQNGNTDTPISMETEEQFERCVSTLRFMLHLKHDFPYNYGKGLGLSRKNRNPVDPQWIELISEPHTPEESEKLAEYIKERGADANGARAYLKEGQVNSLRDGWL